MQNARETSIKVRIGLTIRSLRKEQRLSLRRFGMMTGTNYKYISSIEKGEANPTIDMLERIAQGLDVDITDLIR